MHEQQLQELRREKWRLNGQPVRTLDEAREFIDSVGFCLLYPQRPAVLVPTFVGAYKGSDEKLPMVQHGVRRSRGARGQGADGSPAARESGLRSQRVSRQQLHRLGCGLSLFLRTGGRSQSAAGAKVGLALGIFAAGGGCVSADSEGRSHLQVSPARIAGRRHLRGGAGSRARRAVGEAAHHARRLQAG